MRVVIIEASAKTRLFGDLRDADVVLVKTDEPPINDIVHGRTIEQARVVKHRWGKAGEKAEIVTVVA